MIKLHRLNNKEFIINVDLIKYLESTPDTLLTLDNEKIMVRESVEEVIRLATEYKQKCFQCAYTRKE